MSATTTQLLLQRLVLQTALWHCTC